MNLRDKLRNSAEEATVEAPDSWSPPADDLPPTTKGKGAKPATKSAKAAAALPKLDVNKRFMMLAGAAAFLTALMGVMYINSSAAGLNEGGTKIEVVVLAEDVDRGAALEERLTTAAIPKAYLPKGYIEVGEDEKGLEKAKKLVAVAPMVAGEPIIEARVSPPKKSLGIAYLLKAGERAKTLKVDAASGLAGLIKPGNEVDLIATINDPKDDARRISTPVLQKVKVIAVGNHLLGEVASEAEEKDESGGIESDSTVTLAVAAGKINIVGLLEDLGNLKVVLRAEGDQTVQKTAFTDEAILSLISGRVPSTAKPAVPKPAKPAVAKPIVIYRTAPRPAAVSRPVPHPVVHRPAPPRPAPVSKPVAPPRPPANPNMGIIRFGGAQHGGSDD